MDPKCLWKLEHLRRGKTILKKEDWIVSDFQSQSHVNQMRMASAEGSHGIEYNESDTQDFVMTYTRELLTIIRPLYLWSDQEWS